MKRLFAFALLLLTMFAGSAGASDPEPARPARIARNTTGHCSAVEIGDRYRVLCRRGPTESHARQVAGSPEGVELRITQDGAEATFPVRPGTFTVISMNFETSISARWLPGDPAPVVVID